MPQLSRPSPLTLLYLISVLDLLSLAISLPVLPRLFAHHGISDLAAGYTAGAHSLLVFLAGPLLGRLSDKYGRTPLLRLSAVGTLVGCFLCANATSPAMFIAGRVLPGLFSCRLPVSQAYIADVTAGPMRSAQFGKLTTSFSIAFILGPLVGGMLAKVHFLLPLHVCFVVGVLHLLATMFLPEPAVRTASAPKRQSTDTVLQDSNARTLWAFAHVRVPFMLGKSMYETLFSQHAQRQFGFGGQQIGWMLSYIGVVSVLVNVYVLKRVGKRQMASLVPLAICQAIGLLAWGVSTNVCLAMAAMAALTLSSTCFTNVLDSQMSALVSSDAHGSVMGFCASLDRVTRVVAPSLGGMVLQFLGPQWLGAAAALATLYSVAVLVVGLQPPLRPSVDVGERDDVGARRAKRE